MQISLRVPLWLLKLYIIYKMYAGTTIPTYKYKCTFFPLFKHRRLLGVMGKLEDIGKSCRGKKSIFSSDWEVKKGNSSHFVIHSCHALKCPVFLESWCGFLLWNPWIIHRATSNDNISIKLDGQSSNIHSRDNMWTFYVIYLSPSINYDDLDFN